MVKDQERSTIECWSRRGESSRKANEGQSRRGILIRSGMAFLGVIVVGVVSKVSSATHKGTNGTTNSQSNPYEKLKLQPPRPSDLVSLGEYFSYLSNLPTGARVSDAARAVRGLLGILDNCDLPATRAAARTLRGLQGTYGIGYTTLNESSNRSFAERMIPIRRVLEAEVSDLNSP